MLLHNLEEIRKLNIIYCAPSCVKSIPVSLVESNYNFVDNESHPLLQSEDSFSVKIDFVYLLSM